jgi:hypothetical protein
MHIPWGSVKVGGRGVGRRVAGRNFLAAGAITPL